MIRKEEKFDLVMNALTTVSKKYEESIDDLTNDDIKSAYLKIRHDLVEIIQVFKVRNNKEELIEYITTDILKKLEKKLRNKIVSLDSSIKKQQQEQAKFSDKLDEIEKKQKELENSI